MYKDDDASALGSCPAAATGNTGCQKRALPGTPHPPPPYTRSAQSTNPVLCLCFVRAHASTHCTYVRTHSGEYSLGGFGTFVRVKVLHSVFPVKMGAPHTQVAPDGQREGDTFGRIRRSYARTLQLLDETCEGCCLHQLGTWGSSDCIGPREGTAADLQASGQAMGHRGSVSANAHSDLSRMGPRGHHHDAVTRWVSPARRS
jgi:hypothetical protein